jgi:hypothetical protein
MCEVRKHIQALGGKAAMNSASGIIVKSRTSTDPRLQSFDRPLDVDRVSRPACRFVVSCLIHTNVFTSACLLLGGKLS